MDYLRGRVISKIKSEISGVFIVSELKLPLEVGHTAYAVFTYLAHAHW